MKTLLYRILAVVLVPASIGLLAGCSKEGAEAKKVNVVAMTAGLKTEDREARINACIELGKAGPRAASAVSDLIPLLKDPDPEIRRLSAYALGEIGPEAKSAIPALKELGSDSDMNVRMQVVNTLRSIDPKGFSDLKNVNVTQ